MHPILLHFGPFTLYSYGFFLGLSFFFGVQLARWLGGKDGFSDDLVISTALGIIASSLLGAKALYLLVNAHTVFASWERFSGAIQRGWVFYGGFLAALLFCLLYLWFHLRSVVQVIRFLDLLTPAVGLGLGFTRIGCFLAGCCYGAPCAVPWAVTFPPDSLAASRFGVEHHIHPSQLYASLFGFLLFGILMSVRRWWYHPGRMLGVLLFVYGLYRPIEEELRGDAMRGEWMGLTTSQLISFLLAPLGLAIMVACSTYLEWPSTASSDEEP